MADISIRVEGISKRYRIGLRQEKSETLGGALASIVKRPLTNLQRLRRLSKFDDNGSTPEDVIWALKDICFDVQRGEVVGVIGLNGSGKSTLLKILSRITEPTEGRAFIQGRVSSLLEVGTGFHPELTGRENTYLNGTILGMRRKEIDRKFDEIVDFSGVEKFIDTPVKRYSSGMAVRLAFAVAAHLEPDILLVDEVLAVGDAAFQEKCLGKMGDVAGSGATILFVSHNMGSITTLCHRVILLNQGRLEMTGPPRQTINSYLTRATLDAGLQRAWEFDEAPGGDTVKIKGVTITDAQGVQSRHLSTTEDILVTIEYWVLVDGARANVGFCLFDLMGNPICSVSDINVVRSMAEVKRGLYRSTCIIPKNLLNAGRYTLNVGAYPDASGAGNTRLLEVEVKNCVSFEAIDAHRDYPSYDNWLSLIKPDLEWQVALVGDAQPA